MSNSASAESGIAQRAQADDEGTDSDVNETPDAALAGVALKDGVDRLGVGQVALNEVDLVGLVATAREERKRDGERQCLEHASGETRRRARARLTRAAELAGERPTGAGDETTRAKGKDIPELLARNLLDPTDRGRLRVVAVVDDDGEVAAGEEELEDDVRADVARAAGDEDDLSMGGSGAGEER
jgi:hypothetical protein